MSGTPTDQAARDRAIHGVDDALAVEAGAGTGKTTLLVARIIAGLLVGRYRMNEVAAITFTRKAAAELRARIRSGLAEHLQQAEGEARERLADAQRLLPLAQISTIHSFCSSILHEFPLAAGLDPGFEVAEEGLGAELADELWSEWLTEQLLEDRTAAPFERLLTWGGDLPMLAELGRQVQETMDLSLPVKNKLPRDPQQLWDQVLAKVAGLVEQLEKARITDKADRLLEGLQGFERELINLGALPVAARIRWLLDRGAGRSMRLAPIHLGTGSKANYQPGALEQVKEELKSWRDVQLPAAVQAHFLPLVEDLLAALSRFRDWARSRRLDRGRISQSDLLMLAAEVLTKERAIVRSLSRRYRVLFVDEYQDTDPVQAQIVRMLAEVEDGPVIFLVGDPKQSIYRFRQADVMTYQQDVDTFEKNARLERIDVNFRSTPEVLSLVGEICREVFDPTLYDVPQAAWQDLHPAPDKTSGRLPALVLSPLADEQTKLTADQSARAQALALARQLSQARVDGFQWSEMAVLFPVASRAHLLEEALDGLGVPYRQEKSQRFYRQAEVAEMAAVVAAVSDPWDEMLAVAALRSRLFGISDDVLLRHRVAGGGFLIAGSFQAAGSPPGEMAVLESLRVLARWSRMAGEISPPDLMETILDQTSFLLLLEGVPHGDRAAGNVRKLLDQARAHWSVGGYGLEDYAGWLQRKVYHEQAREAESPAPDDQQRVSLLTIHAAKGLEWQVVGLFGVDHAPRQSSPCHLRERESRQLEVRLAHHLKTTGYSQALETDQALGFAERARLLYVALTRAGERLLIPFPAVGPAAKGSLLAMLRLSQAWRGWESRAGEGQDPQAPRIALPREPQPGSARPKKTRSATPDPERAIAQALTLRAGWQGERTRLLEGADQTVVTTPSELHDHRAERPAVGLDPLGREVGTAVHQALEWWVLSKRRSGGGVVDGRALAARAAQRAGLEGAGAERAIELFDRGIASDLLAQALDSELCLPEWPFAWRGPLDRLPPAVQELIAAKLRGESRPDLHANGQVLLEGIADLVFAGPKGLVVVDYKTDRWQGEPEFESLVAYYRPQLEAYAAALEGAAGRVESAWLLFLGGAEVRGREVLTGGCR